MKKYNTDLPEIIYNPFVSQMINELEAFEENEIEMDWNSFGGSVWSGNQFADFLINTDKKITSRTTGMVISMGASLLPFFHKTIGAKQCDVMIHSTLSSVTSITKRSNQNLYNALKIKINEKKFEEITGFNLEKIMFLEGNERIDVWCSGQDAYDFGLFDELVDITPKEELVNIEKFNEYKLTASLDYKLPEKFQKKELTNNESMKNVDELKKNHPDLYNEVFEEGKNEGFTAGSEKEKNRVDAWMVFNDVSPEEVKVGVESGKEMTKAQELNFMRKAQLSDMQKNLENSSAGDVIPDKKTGKLKTDAEKEAEELENALENVGIEKEVD